MKKRKSRERHFALCTNFVKDVENFSAEGRAASIGTSYIAKRNAVERDVDGGSVERSFSISIGKVWLNIWIEISGAMHEVHLKNRAIVTVHVDLQHYVVFSSIVEATTGFFSVFCLKYFLHVLHLPFIYDSEDSDSKGPGL